jgi:hypothetical protein
VCSRSSKYLPRNKYVKGSHGTATCSLRDGEIGEWVTDRSKLLPSQCFGNPLFDVSIFPRLASKIAWLATSLERTICQSSNFVTLCSRTRFPRSLPTRICRRGCNLSIRSNQFLSNDQYSVRWRMLGEAKQNEDDVGGVCDLFSGSRAPWVLGIKSPPLEAYSNSGPPIETSCSGACYVTST